MQVARLQWQIPIFGAKRLYLVAVFFSPYFFMLDLDSRRIASSAPLGAHQSKLATLQDRPRPAVPVTYLQRMCFIAS